MKFSEEIKDTIIQKYYEYSLIHGRIKILSDELGLDKRAVSYFIRKTFK